MLKGRKNVKIWGCTKMVQEIQNIHTNWKNERARKSKNMWQSNIKIW